jgi:hypothetical protein
MARFVGTDVGHEARDPAARARRGQVLEQHRPEPRPCCASSTTKATSPVVGAGQAVVATTPMTGAVQRRDERHAASWSTCGEVVDVLVGQRGR